MALMLFSYRSKAPLLLILSGAWLAVASAYAEPMADAVAAAHRWRVQNERQILEEHIELVRIPNVSRDAPNIRRNADHLVGLLSKRGLNAKLLGAPDAPPLVYGELLSTGASSTYVFYAHYDGQAVDPKEWASPPFEPTLRSGTVESGGAVVALKDTRAPYPPDWRLYARAVADDKAPITAMLAALDALRAAGIAARANLKFVFDGEEEIGSPNLARLLGLNKELLRGDLWIICDGPQHRSGRQTIVFGVRGAQAVEITVYGANKDVHSGHYGNWAPNPAMMLAQLLASMKDESGRILINGFYDDVAPLTDEEREAIEAIPDDDAQMKRSMVLARTEGGGRRLAELITLPALNVRGLKSGRTGSLAGSVIPSTATAAMDIRLVKGMSREKTIGLLIRHIEQQGYFVSAAEPDESTLFAHGKVARLTLPGGGYNAARTRMDLPVARKLMSALETVSAPLILQPSIGASLPLAVIEEVVQSPTITVSMVNHDNNQHAKNENLRLGNLWDAIESIAAMYAME